MSIKRQLQFQYKQFIRSIFSWSCPAWINSNITRVILIALIVGLGTGYILKTTSGAAAGYEMNKLENDVIKLTTEISTLEVEIAENSSIEVVSDKIKNMNMIEVDKITYLKPIEDIQVAKK